jgi:hypothetical protein
MTEGHLEIEEVVQDAAFDRFVSEVGVGIQLVAEPIDSEGGIALRPDGVDFAKWIREKHATIPVSVPSAPRQVLHSHDIWIPLAFLATDCGLPVFLSLVANYAYDRLKGALKGANPTIHLSAEYIDTKSGEIRRFQFKGDAKALQASIRKFDPNKFLNGQ